MLMMRAYTLQQHVDFPEELPTVQDIINHIEKIGKSEEEICSSVFRLIKCFNMAIDFGKLHRCYIQDLRPGFGFRAFVEFSELSGMQIHGFMWKEDNNGTTHYVGVTLLEDVYSKFGSAFYDMDPTDFNDWINHRCCVEDW